MLLNARFLRFPRRRLALISLGALIVVANLSPSVRGDEASQTKTTVERFRKAVEPMLARYCYDCHGGGQKRGSVSLDAFADADGIAHNPDLWLRVLRNIRAGIMPPANKPRPSAAEMAVLETWIKWDAFGLDPKNPDPGQVRIRRLTRVEYRNTIRDLLGVDYDTSVEFPADDNNGSDVLAVTDLLIEKYMQAAKSVISSSVPAVTKVPPQRNIMTTVPLRAVLFYNKKAKIADTFQVEHGGKYRLIVELEPKGVFAFDPGRAMLTEKFDDQQLSRLEYTWRDFVVYHYEYDLKVEPGTHSYSIEVEPLPPVGKGSRGGSVGARVKSVTLVGPLSREHMHHPANYEKFFPRDEPPAQEPERGQYARDILARFVSRAYRRPADERTLDRLVEIARIVSLQPDKTFEQGIGQAMVAVLSSPRFFFRMEESDPQDADKEFARVDEYSLASRLAYFLWSTMPDEELYSLAAKGELRKNLAGQVARMLKNPRAGALTQNFVAQWLQTRDVDTVPIDPGSILKRDGTGKKVVLSADLRASMRRETEMLFSHILNDDRSVLELVDSDYTFLDEALAKHYGMEGVTGKEMRKVRLAKDSPRGSVLTHASVLMVTSNATRTSPVKRGAFILDNILGSPTPPPPGNVPLLEEAAKELGRDPTVRQLLEQHRANALCSSCHARMDPLGQSLESFNAMGMFRTKELGQPIESAGKLISGEPFASVRDLKRILTHERRADYYRCLTQKLMTFAVGRGLDYRDVDAVDRIVDRLERAEGRFSVLIGGVIDSAPFQLRRNPHVTAER